jgi:sugar/nucleoside kinase (ribokinase family)
MPALITSDLAFIGHVCRDEVIPFGGSAQVAPGSAVLCGAMAAAGAGVSVSVITRMARRDDELLSAMRQRGIAVHVIASEATTYMRVRHPSPDVDDRVMDQLASAGRFRLEDIPALDVRQVHLAGISDQEFDLQLVQGLRGRGVRLSADMQSFVRQVDPATGRIAFADVPAKADLAGLLDMVKLDVVEAQVLTGTDDLEQAAIVFERWGCPEIVVSRADGALARVAGETHWERFSNRRTVGRTGRGDTLFAAYAARRLDHGPREALRFAAALVSLKMERPGPFTGTLADVLARLGGSVAA